ncbi:hypothetical protein ITP53_17625 [Nonomuraea sp. K274]|uniref:Uncharacterized protein n=1 Tax=Nonomuraea cypriaca TaxID=1187855 RepID=A0A931EX89_9ACTN|nr:hypothetical protein [Nonomuraea cypriaca]MBF8187519.1 hypothetical protein [Nonomuraea cypriaca]
MLALVVDHDVPAGLRLGETTDPVPASDQVLIEVRAILNHGELRGIASQPAGYVPGWDAAGVVRTLRPTAPGRPRAAGSSRSDRPVRGRSCGRELEADPWPSGTV